MSNNTISQREHTILCNLSRLPRKMLALHHHDRLADLVMHELCGKECFNLSKAAYLVDNPDFNCMKGIAGYSQCDAQVLQGADMWQQPEAFSEKAHKLPFNQKVRSVDRCSLKRGSDAQLDLAREIAHDLEIKNPGFCMWNLKHDNHGLLIFEYPECDEACSQDCMMNGCSLLGFCPIY